MTNHSKQVVPEMNRMTLICVWIVLLGGMTWVANKILDYQFNPNTTIRTQISSDGVSEVVLKQNRQGHYLTIGEINGESVQFLLDTGATHVSIPLVVAERIGLSRGPAMSVHTANGSIQVYSTRLDTVSIGDIELKQIRASINPFLQGEEILLGMSFLKNLELTQSNKELILSLPN